MPPPLRLLPGAFTVEKYYKLGELGVFHEDDRVELVNGQIVPMSPIGDAHANCVRRLNTLLSRRLGERAIVDVQNPVILGEYDSPQPDITVLKSRADGYRKHPRSRDILLVIEVADSSLAYDRDVKIPRYAQAGISEVWIVDVNAETIGVYRDPESDGYRSVQTVKRGEIVRPVKLAAVQIGVDEILG
jgi:Uma2 family endonuclease